MRYTIVIILSFMLILFETESTNLPPDSFDEPDAKKARMELVDYAVRISKAISDIWEENGETYSDGCSVVCTESNFKTLRSISELDNERRQDLQKLELMNSKFESERQELEQIKAELEQIRQRLEDAMQELNESEKTKKQKKHQMAH